MEKVNFSTLSGGRIFFDENGDSVALYDLVNWQMRSDGSVNIVNIGRYDASYPDEQKFLIKENMIVWGGNQSEVTGRIIITEYNITRLLGLLVCKT